tara:strand:- start:9 stop:1007 length:999 start_codon:yes stop_codon:yes gene_type:complete
MKFAVPLSLPEKITLEELMKNGRGYKERMRAHAILLSAARYPINEIASIMQHSRDRVSGWINRWESLGIVGLFDNPRSGRPPKLEPSEIEQAVQVIKDNPKSLKKVQSIVEEKTGKQVSYDTIKKVAKSAGMIWKRVRKSLKKKRDPEEFERVQLELNEYREQAKSGEIDLVYFDESGFDLTPSVPYAWQEVNETIELPASKSTRINVLGFMQENNSLEPYVFEGKVDSTVVLACFNDFVKRISRKTVVYLDNASIHTSEIFKDQLKEWEKEGLFVKFLPKYSPELNRIEILWRFIKYQWLPFDAYAGMRHLRIALDKILANFGSEYCITFA